MDTETPQEVATPKSAACSGCGTPLPYTPLNLSAPHYCDACSRCSVCGYGVPLQEIQICIRNEWEVQHMRCMSEARLADLRSQPVTITQGHLDYLNAVRLLVEPRADLSVDTNITNAEIQLTQLLNVHQLSLDEQFLMMKRLEAISMALFIVLKKDKVTIQKELDARAREKMEAVTEQRRAIASKTPHAKAETRQLSKEERQREKAIAALTSLGISRADAEKAIPTCVQIPGAK